MSAMTDVFETALVTLLFNNTDIANVGDAGGLRGSVAPGSTQLALASVAYIDGDTLLTADEIAYTGYLRPTQARSGAGWTISGAVASNTALIVFGEMTAGGPDTAVHVGLGFLDTGNQLDLHADLTADLVINNGVNPQFAIGAITWTAQ